MIDLISRPLEAIYIYSYIGLRPLYPKAFVQADHGQAFSEVMPEPQGLVEVPGDLTVCY